MHLANGRLPEAYLKSVGLRLGALLAALATLAAGLVVAISLGAADLSFADVLWTLLGRPPTPRHAVIVLSIRLPQALAAILAGAGLSVAGAAMQSILRNPLGSPFTLGVSHAAAFGAAFAVMVLGGGVMTSKTAGAAVISSPFLTTVSAFAASLIAAGLIVAVARLKGATPEIMVLCGVALGALFTAGTMFLQYLADDAQLAAMVFWTFGDAARASWRDLAILAGVTIPIFLYFWAGAWSLNAIDAGDETARGLGVRVEGVRMAGMLAASLLTAVIIAFLGVIGFVGLVAPHLTRRTLGGDNRFLVPGACLVGALLLLASDVAARLVLAPRVLPVSVVTAFLGAPAFLMLVLAGGGRR